MIRTNCAACAAPLAHDHKKRCSRCKTRYCNEACQRQYARVLYHDTGATLDDLREAVTTLEDAGRIARRVLGGAHPTTGSVGLSLLDARAALRARETPSPPGQA